METVNKRIFRLIKEKNHSQKEMAIFLDVRDSNISSWKIRGSSIDSKHIPKIAEFLGASETYLLEGKEKAPFEGASHSLIKFFKKLQDNNMIDLENLTDKEGEELYNTFKIALEVQKSIKK